ncbi:Alpha-galactosidase A [subsurface metagenome]
MKRIFLILLSLLTFISYAQKFENLALTPPMGWNSWNYFSCNVDEELIRETADAMISTGMKDAGYTYINIDDCWHGKRDSLGFTHHDRAIQLLVDFWLFRHLCESRHFVCCILHS